ncbi:exocyst complex component [Trichophyton mentagrophytes]|nr:exocyst complex component [Trichophyton mentagrophytes]
MNERRKVRLSLLPGSTLSVAQRRAAFEQKKDAGAGAGAAAERPQIRRTRSNRIRRRHEELQGIAEQPPPQESKGGIQIQIQETEIKVEVEVEVELPAPRVDTVESDSRPVDVGADINIARQPPPQLQQQQQQQELLQQRRYSRWIAAAPRRPSTLRTVTVPSPEPPLLTPPLTSSSSDSLCFASPVQAPAYHDSEPPCKPAAQERPQLIIHTPPTSTRTSSSTASDSDMADENGSDGSLVVPRLEDLLRHPEDLEKISVLKAEYTRKKENVDSQLREGLRDQLELVQRSLADLAEGRRQIMDAKMGPQGIDRLWAESQSALGDFAQIDKLAKIQRNFEAVLFMKKGLETFHADVAEVERMLREDDMDMENQPNLLSIHMALSRLRDFRDEAMDQIRRAKDKSSEATLTELFEGLDPAIEWFDDHLGTACMNIIPLIQADNRSMVVRLAVVIANEEKNDAKVRELQDAQKDHEYLASRFKSMNIGPKTIRGYKENFLKSIELYAQPNFEDSKQQFLDDPDRLEKSFKWFFNDLFTVQQGMQNLVPKKWKIFKTYTDIYHRMMHDWLIEFVDDPQMPAANMLAIINWSEKYYKKMKKLGWEASDLVPNVLDDREGELVQDWRNLIVKALDEWMDRMFNTDKRAFLDRDMDSLDTNPDGFFRTKTLGDMWRMLHEQLQAAGASQRTDVAEGVVDAMFRSLKTRQSMWQTMLDEECAKYKTPTIDQPESLQQFQDWLIAVANDQIACIDDNDASGQLGHLTRFNRDFEPLVTDKYLTAQAANEVAILRDGYVDLGTHCISVFIDLIFSVDFRTTLPEFFTQKWYGEFAMKRMISTFEDYISDYHAVLHPSLRDILVEEISDELLVHYLSCVRNKGAKFRRQDPYTEKFKDDILTVFGFFQKFPDSFGGGIKDRWRLVDWLVRLLEADKAGVVVVYEGFKTEYWDLQLSWVEAVLRCRDDFERSMVSAIKAKAAELSVEMGPDTLMGRVR